MALILNEDGHFVNSTDKTIDQLKRDSYKHKNNIKEDIEDLVDDMVEEAEEIEADTYEFDEGELEEMEAEEISDDEVGMMELAVMYGEFSSMIKDAFEDSSEIDEFLEGIEAYLGSKGVEINLEEGGFEAEIDSDDVLEDSVEEELDSPDSEEESEEESEED